MKKFEQMDYEDTPVTITLDSDDAAQLKWLYGASLNEINQPVMNCIMVDEEYTACSNGFVLSIMKTPEVLLPYAGRMLNPEGTIKRGINLFWLLRDNYNAVN